MTGSNNTFSQMLSCNPTLTYVNQHNAEGFWFSYDVIASAVSSISLLIVACLILFDKRLQMHPNMLVAIICLCDSFLFFQFMSRYLICGYGWSPDLNYFYAVTVQYPWVWLTCHMDTDNPFEQCWAGAQSSLNMNGVYRHTV